MKSFQINITLAQNIRMDIIECVRESCDYDPTQQDMVIYIFFDISLSVNNKNLSEYHTHVHLKPSARENTFGTMC